ncbi:MAG: hypothetical protein COB08_005525 [Rhodobacteraceae bacterium]|nr:hypothetical protein [Paracoccaceae bacterium]
MFDFAIQEIDGEARMRDLDIAMALEFERPRKIRELIVRRSAELGELGEVRPTAGRTSAQGGAPSEEYWLNEKQALFICTKSETKMALDITIQMIEVFSAWRHGQLVPRSTAGPSEVGQRDVIIAAIEDVNFDRMMTLMREARVTHGKSAAQRLWLQAGLPLPDAEAVEAEQAQKGELALFLRDYCICTGDAAKFTRTAELLVAYKHWCKAVTRAPLSDGTFAHRLPSLAKTYLDPATGFGFTKHKASVSGYLGVVVDPFVMAA